ncbi:uncharacterized protein LOC143253832 [Tachypleus tridentatus]|uniref:uncharacterized protein LOC143253832 n=1 Tax=Tachypleus tridentatus TaxID=6853 RepID=UPI003FD4AAFB
MAEQTSTEASSGDGMRAKSGSNESVDGKTRVRNRRPDKQLYVPRARRLMETKASPSAIQDTAVHSALSTQLISSRVEKITGEVESKDEHLKSLNNLATSDSRPLNVTKSQDSVSDKNVTEDLKLCLRSVNQTDNISGTDKEDSTESKLFHPSFVKQHKEKKIRMENAMSSSVYLNMHSSESGNCVLTDSLFFK